MFALGELLLLQCLIGCLVLLHLRTRDEGPPSLFPSPEPAGLSIAELADLLRPPPPEVRADDLREVSLPLAHDLGWTLWITRRDQLERRADRIVLPLLDDRFEAAIEIVTGFPRPWRLGPTSTLALERLLPAALRRQVVVEPGRIVHRQPVPPTSAQRVEITADLALIARLLLADGPEAVAPLGVAVRAGAGPTRCAFCRDDLGHDAARCAGCATALHSECWAELRRCPTAGCRQAA